MAALVVVKGKKPEAGLDVGGGGCCCCGRKKTIGAGMMMCVCACATRLRARTEADCWHTGSASLLFAVLAVLGYGVLESVVRAAIRSHAGRVTILTGLAAWTLSDMAFAQHGTVPPNHPSPAVVDLLLLPRQQRRWYRERRTTANCELKSHRSIAPRIHWPASNITRSSCGTTGL